MYLSPQHLPPLAPLQATTPPTPAPHPGLELTGIIRLLGVHWPCTPQGQPLPRTSACRALHSLARHPDTAQTGRQRAKEPLLPGRFTSQHPPVGRKGTSELQELRADKRLGCIQGKDPRLPEDED